MLAQYPEVRFYLGPRDHLDQLRGRDVLATIAAAEWILEERFPQAARRAARDLGRRLRAVQAPAGKYALGAYLPRRRDQVERVIDRVGALDLLCLGGG